MGTYHKKQAEYLVYMSAVEAGPPEQSVKVTGEVSSCSPGPAI
jgi:hypothetical protein